MKPSINAEINVANKNNAPSVGDFRSKNYILVNDITGMLCFKLMGTYLCVNMSMTIAESSLRA